MILLIENNQHTDQKVIQLRSIRTHFIQKEETEITKRNVQREKQTNTQMLHTMLRLETFAVNNAWTGFIIFLFTDPHLLESGK
jgi:alanine racemase